MVKTSTKAPSLLALSVFMLSTAYDYVGDYDDESDTCSLSKFQVLK